MPAARTDRSVSLSLGSRSSVNVCPSRGFVDWRRPAWFGHATWESLFLMVLAWLWGLAVGAALQSLEEKCSIRHHQPYDDAY